MQGGQVLGTSRELMAGKVLGRIKVTEGVSMSSGACGVLLKV